MVTWETAENADKFWDSDCADCGCSIPLGDKICDTCEAGDYHESRYYVQNPNGKPGDWQ